MDSQHRRFMRVIASILSALSISFFIACGPGPAKSYPSPPGYVLSQPGTYHLPADLDEISGIYYYEKDTTIFAIGDEMGWLYKIRLDTPLRVERWRFSGTGDYEDITLVDSTFFVLKAKGKMEKFSFSGTAISTLKAIEIPQPGKREFETIFFDRERGRIACICKDCKAAKDSDVPVWFFDPRAGSFSSSVIDMAEALKKLGNTDLDQFKPSAGAIHPITGEWFLIASVNKALAVLDERQNLKQVYPLDPGIFNQPEGLTFTPAGDLIISNEIGDEGAANILFFKYQKQ